MNIFGGDRTEVRQDELSATAVSAQTLQPSVQELLDGKADYLIAGYYPGLAEAAREGVKDKVAPLNQALLTQRCLCLSPRSRRAAPWSTVRTGDHGVHICKKQHDRGRT